MKRRRSERVARREFTPPPSNDWLSPAVTGLPLDVLSYIYNVHMSPVTRVMFYWAARWPSAISIDAPVRSDRYWCTPLLYAIVCEGADELFEQFFESLLHQVKYMKHHAGLFFPFFDVGRSHGGEVSCFFKFMALYGTARMRDCLAEFHFGTFYTRRDCNNLASYIACRKQQLKQHRDCAWHEARWRMFFQTIRTYGHRNLDMRDAPWYCACVHAKFVKLQSAIKYIWPTDMTNEVTRSIYLVVISESVVDDPTPASRLLNDYYDILGPGNLPQKSLEELFCTTSWLRRPNMLHWFLNIYGNQIIRMYSDPSFAQTLYLPNLCHFVGLKKLLSHYALTADDKTLLARCPIEARVSGSYLNSSFNELASSTTFYPTSRLPYDQLLDTLKEFGRTGDIRPLLFDRGDGGRYLNSLLDRSQFADLPCNPTLKFDIEISHGFASYDRTIL